MNTNCSQPIAGVVFSIIALLSCPMAVSAAPPTVHVAHGELTISGFEPGGEIVIVGVDRGIGRSGSIRVTPVAVLEHDDDRDGVIRHRGEVSVRSVWVAIDYATGEYAVAAPEEFGVRQRQIESSNLKRDQMGDILALVDERPRLLLVLVRPRRGAWGVFGVEGGTKDADRSPNGKLTIDFESIVELKPGRGRAPSRLQKDDVIVGIDPGRLDLFTITVGK
jgi:hypothetical protein